MSGNKSFLQGFLGIICIFLCSSFFTHVNDKVVVLTGSTPGDEEILRKLGLPVGTNVDFIRWHLKLEPEGNFILYIQYGESKPNTLGFLRDGEKRTIRGEYLVNNRPENKDLPMVLDLKSQSLSQGISLTKISENVYHLLSVEGTLLCGNGGWSYSLHRIEPVAYSGILISSADLEIAQQQDTFDGRTPCQEISRDHLAMNASESCFKLKWRLILKRDTNSLAPTTYTMRQVVDNKPVDVHGKWKIISGMATHPKQIFYELIPDQKGDSFLLFAADHKVLFFCDKNHAPYTGNQDFSFALNKRN